ncbi:unnamed protein product [Lymnaea stagnalis]|uniref:Uncharacterized protein n=1 Tax=Lymnaea stagnalis TaxID=6523 RepID=A0AAV2HPM6_LYMST
MYKVFLVVTPSGQQSTDEETMRYHGILVYPKRELTGVKQEKQPEEDVSLHVVTLPFFKCPGSIASNIVRAAKKLIVTAAVLFFIFLVVKAYGDASELSMINQLLALIIVAFFPFWSGCFFAVPNTDHLQQNKCISRIYRRPQKCNLIFQKINRATNPQDHESILTETRNSSSLQTANNLSEYDFLSSIVMGAFEVR